MTFEEQATSLSPDQIVSLLVSQQDLTKLAAEFRHHNGELINRNGELSRRVDELTTRNDELARQLEWFKRQLFGAKSERRLLGSDARQMALGEPFHQSPSEAEATVAVENHSRRRGKAPWEGTPEDSGLRFDPSVPVVEIEVANPDSEIYPPGSYDVVGEKVSYRLAQRPGCYEVLRYRRKVLKLKGEEKFSCPPAPSSVLEKSYADVSLLAGLVIDKFRFHLPLYRQHQRLEAAGIRVSRSSLTQWVHRTADLLEPIHQAQLASILAGSVVAMDETPIRVGRKRTEKGKGKMRSGYFWPLYGDRDEVSFLFSSSRGSALVEEALRGFEGVLLTDGYAVYDSYAKTVNDLVHAQCWSHTRRKFDESEAVEPELSGRALDWIGRLYEQEERIRKRGLEERGKLEYRAQYSKPLVDGFFEWLQEAFRERILLPTNPFTQAASYALDRQAGLRVFLEYPDVPVDTNHLERQIRPIAVGRKNWMFCWTEVGAKYTGILQSLLATCRLHGVDPYTYLVDVLQRVAIHPAGKVEQLTPRLWTEHFAAKALRSDINTIRQ
jgi:transposase